MTKPKQKAKPKISAKEKKAREYRRTFERVCDFIISGEKGEGIKEITADKSLGISHRKFFSMLELAPVSTGHLG